MAVRGCESLRRRRGAGTNPDKTGHEIRGAPVRLHARRQPQTRGGRSTRVRNPNRTQMSGSISPPANLPHEAAASAEIVARSRFCWSRIGTRPGKGAGEGRRLHRGPWQRFLTGCFEAPSAGGIASGLDWAGGWYSQSPHEAQASCPASAEMAITATAEKPIARRIEQSGKTMRRSLWPEIVYHKSP